MKNIYDFMEKEISFTLYYPQGSITIEKREEKLYAKVINNDEDYEAYFFFVDESDLQDKCEERGFEVRFCDYCGKPFNAGYTDDDADFYNCEDCFEKDMDERYGKGNWRPYESEDGDCNWQGGYYERFIDGKWEAEPSYYTEWY